MLTRRNALLGLGLATAGCAGELMGGRLPPGIQTGNIAPDDNLVLGPDENILVGMVARVHRVELLPGERSEPSFFSKIGMVPQVHLIELLPGERFEPSFFTKIFGGSPRPLFEFRDPDEISTPVFQGPPDFFIMEADRFRQFGLPLRRRSTEFIIIRQPGQTIRLSPFAMRVPKGPYRIVALKRDGLGVYNLSPLEARVRPGTIAYIGRFGPITQIVRYSESAFEKQLKGLSVFSWSNGQTTAIEPNPDMSDRLWYLRCGTFNRDGGPPRCEFKDLFFHNDADQDLPLLRQHFPRLANAQIVNAPIAPSSSQVWKRWPDVLRPLSVS
jgi:hypothetical protein